jgi:YjbE family integral membrane protein
VFDFLPWVSSIGAWAANFDFGFHPSDLMLPTFWAALMGILWVDLLLSGDNALVIALATKNLPPQQQRWAMIGGIGVAVGLRIIGGIFATALITTPYVATVAGLALLVIAYKLVAAGEEEHGIAAKATLWGAITTIGIADASMSVDNVIAVAGMAHGNGLLMTLGILFSIPMVIFGSVAISWLLKKFPLLVWAGAGVLGWVAGGIIAHDKAAVEALGVFWIMLAPLLGASLVLVAGILTRVLRKPEPLGVPA